MEEQVAELQRQTRIKLLAAEADARWEAKPSLLDRPPTKTTKTSVIEEGLSQKSEPEPQGVSTSKIASQVRAQAQTRKREDTPATATGSEAPSPENDPWRRADRSAPGEAWQPEAWTPTSAKKR